MNRWTYAMLAMLLPLAPCVANDASSVPRIEYIEKYDADQIRITFPVVMAGFGQAETQLLPAEQMPQASPEIACRWAWLSTRELQCLLSSEQRLRGSSRYELNVPAMPSVSGATVAAFSQAIETPRPKWSGGGTSWQSLTAGKVTLAFDAGVELDSLKRELYLLDQQTQQRWSLPDLALNGPPEHQRFVATLPLGLRAGGSYTLGFGSGVKPMLGDLPLLAEKRHDSVLTPREFAYIGITCSPDSGQPIAIGYFQPRPECAPATGVLLWFSEEPSEATRHQLKSMFQAQFESLLSTARIDPVTLQSQRTAVVRLSGLPSHQKFDIALVGATDIWERSLPRSRIRLKTRIWARSLRIGKLPDVFRLDQPTPLPLQSINTRRLVLKLQQVTRDGVRHSRHRIRAPKADGNLWQDWTLDLKPYLDKRGALVRGTLELPDGEGSAQFGFNYSDVEFVVRHFDEQLMIWVIDGNTRQPVVGTSISLHYGWDDKKKFAEASTDAAGFIALKMPDNPSKNDTQAWQYDTWWLRLTDRDRFAVAPFNLYNFVRGEWRSGEPGSSQLRVNIGDALLWGITDKHLYSPGEAVRYTFFVRRKERQALSCVDNKTGYYLAMFDQDEKIVLEQGPFTLDARCAASGQIDLPTSLSHGPHHIIVRDHPVTNEDFDDDVNSSMQPFRGRFWIEVANPRPPAVNVTVSADRAVWDTWTGPLTVTTAAKYFSGGPQAGATLTLEGIFRVPGEYDRNSDPRSRKFPYYTFEVFDASERLEAQDNATPISDEREADAEGTMATRVEAWPWMPGYSKFSADGSSKGSDGQSYEGWAGDAEVFHNTEFVGLQLRTWFARIGQPLKTRMVVLDRGFAAQSGKPVRLTLYRHPLNGDDDKRGAELSHCEATSAVQPVTCSLTPTAAGQFELVAAIIDSRGRVHEASESLTVYAADSWGWDSDDAPRVELRGDKSEYVAGDTAHLTLMHPYSSGRALVNVERDGLLASFWIELTPDETAFDVTVTQAMRDGASVNVSVYPQQPTSPRARLSSSIDLVVRSTSPITARIHTDQSSYRPGDTVKADVQLTVAAQRGILVTVVDSALIKLIAEADDFFNPHNSDFLKSFQSWKVADEITPTQWISKVAERDQAEFGKVLASSSRYQPADLMRENDAFGEEAFERLEYMQVTGSRIRRSDLMMTSAEEGVVLPKSGSQNIEHWRARIRQQFRQTAYWLAQGETDAQGHAELNFKLPDNLTGWTVMVIAYDADNEFGFGKAQFLAQLPIEARITGPEHAVMGDKLGISAVIRNAEDQTKRIKAQLTVKLDSAAAPSVKRAEQRQTGYAESLLATQVDTARQQGESTTARWLVQAQDATGEDAVAGEVFVRAPIVDKRFQSSVLVPAGQPLVLDFAEPHDSYDHSAVLRWRPVSLLTGVAETVDYMRAYPHRCWEQRTSRTWSAVLGQDLLSVPSASAEDAAAARFAILDDWIKDAAQFQTPAGGFAFWQNDEDYADVQLSTYTAEAIRSFRALGWKGGREVEHRLQQYLKGQWAALSKDHVKTDVQTLTTLLAVAGNELRDNDVLARLSIESATLSNDSLMRLLQAHWLRDRTAPEVARLRAELIGRGFERAGMVELSRDRDNALGYWLGSMQSSQCRAASVLVRTAGTAEERMETYRWLRSAQLQRQGSGEFGNTQDNTYCLQAVADLAAAGVRIDADAAITLAIHGDQPKQVAAQTASPLVLQPQNRITLRTIQDKPVWLEVVIDYRADAKRDSDRQQGFTLQRKYEVMRNRKWITASEHSLQVGDWVRVTLDLQVSNTQSHVALSDALPGALVAVDPEHDATVPVHILGELTSDSPFYEHQFRDGYARFYAEELYSGSHRVQYFAKVITHGRYQALPAKLEAMYDPTRFATSGNQVFEVAQPK